MKVLIIEDNDQNRYLVRFLLEKHGHDVLEAQSGSEGLALARREFPELILLDIQLPEMDGYEVARRLRANGDLHHVPIVAVTSYAMVGDRDHILASGCDGYIEKPIDPSTFVDEVKRFVVSGRQG